MSDTGTGHSLMVNNAQASHDYTSFEILATRPSGRDAALSCGAVLEGMVLALSQHGYAADVSYTQNDVQPSQGLVAVAHLRLFEGPEDKLHKQLERRFTWRGAFDPSAAELFGWT